MADPSHDKVLAGDGLDDDLRVIEEVMRSRRDASRHEQGNLTDLAALSNPWLIRRGDARPDPTLAGAAISHSARVSWSDTMNLDSPRWEMGLAADAVGRCYGDQIAGFQQDVHHGRGPDRPTAGGP